MWDRKRQIIWLLSGIVFGSVFLYPLARDETGFGWQYFLQLEALLVLVMIVMLYIYSRRKP